MVKSKPEKNRMLRADVKGWCSPIYNMCGDYIVKFIGNKLSSIS